MKKPNFKLTLSIIGIMVCIIYMVFLVPISKKKLIDNDSGQRIIIVDKQTGDTLLNRSLNSFSPKELDRFTKFLNER